VKKYTVHKFLFITLMFVFLVLFSVVACKPANKYLQMPTPKNIRLNEEEFLVWDAVEGTELYCLDIDGEQYTSNTNSFDVFSIFLETKTYNVSVLAYGNDVYGDSDWSEVKPIEYEVADISAIQHAPTDKGECTIRAGAGKTIVGKLVLPGHVNDYKVTSIYYEGFKGQKEITGLYIPDTVKTIEKGAFDDCAKINRIRFPEEEVCEIGLSFKGLKSLKRLHLPDNVKIYPMTRQMEALEEVTVDPERGSKVDGNCLIRKHDNVLVRGFVGAIIPDYVTRISKNAFAEVKIEELVIPESVKEIGDGAFEGSSLKKVVLPNSIKEVGSWFNHCADLEEVVLGNRTEVLNASFYDCISLSKIEFPDTLKELKAGLFGGCVSLESIDLNKVEKIYGGVFNGAYIKKLHIPATLTNLTSMMGTYNPFANCVALEEITVAQDNPVYFGDANCVIERETNSLIVGCKNSVIPSYVKELGFACFTGSHIEKMVIPVGVEKIGRYAFKGCVKLRELYIPNTVWFIGVGAFTSTIPTYAISIPNSVTDSDGNAQLFDYNEFAFYSDAKDPNSYIGGYFMGGEHKATMGYDGNYPYVVSITLDPPSAHTLQSIYGGEYYVHAPCRQGYTFAGWATEPDGQVVLPVKNKVKHVTIPSGSYYLPPEYVTRSLMVSLDNNSELLQYPKGTVLYAVWIPN